MRPPSFPPTAALPPPDDDSLTTAITAVANAVATLAATAAADTEGATKTAAAAAASSTIADGSPTEDEHPGECQLLGSFALLVQAALGGLALLSLVYKRWKERPQRPVKIWFFDASKQVFGSVLVHIANVFMSLLTSGNFSLVEPTPPHKAMSMLVAREGGEPYIPNPCSFYLLNLAIDTTIGIPILIGLVHLTTKLVSYTPVGQPPESIQSGYYGNPPKASWWLKQSIIYFCGLFGMKIVVLVIFLVFPFISRVGDWALGWTEGNEKVQIVFVMMLFPLIMNAMQYYIIDSFIKKQPDHHGLEDGGEHHHHHHHRGGRHGGRYQEVMSDDDGSASSSSDDGEESDTDLDLRLHHSAVSNHGAEHGKKQERRKEYDPITDGDSQTIVGSSGSDPKRTPRQGGGAITKDLYPRE